MLSGSIGALAGLCGVIIFACGGASSGIRNSNMRLDLDYTQ